MRIWSNVFWLQMVGESNNKRDVEATTTETAKNVMSVEFSLRAPSNVRALSDVSFRTSKRRKASHTMAAAAPLSFVVLVY